MNENEDLDVSSTDQEPEDKKVVGVKMIMELMKENSVWLFTDQFKEAYAKISGCPVMKLDSPEFAQWLFNLMYENGHITNETSLKAAIKIMKYQAGKEIQIELWVRVAKQQNYIIYDLDNENFVEISPNGWEILSDKEFPVFRKFAHQKAQVKPIKGGKLDDFFQLLNLSSENDELLLKIYLIAAFIPGFPHPVFVFHGPQGSAKTTACKLIKDLIDPSTLDTTSLRDDKDIAGFIQTCSHHWLTILDNLSYLPDRISDVISRITTGGGISKRTLYTNDDDFIYNIKHLIGLNGINQVISKSDLLDRTLIISLDRITDDKRMTEVELLAKFEEMKPNVLGAIFDAVSGALRIYPQVKLTSLPRLADFAMWGCAIAEALGYQQIDFIKAFDKNRTAQNQEAVDADPLAAVILKFMENRDSFEATPSETHKELTRVAQDLQLIESKSWPKTSATMSKQMTSIIPNLATFGIKVEKAKTTERIIIFTKFHIEDQSMPKDSAKEPDPLVARALAIFGGHIDTTDSKDGIFLP